MSSEIRACSIQARLVQRLPGRVLAREILHGRCWHWMEHLTQVVKISRIRVWLEMLSETAVDLQPIGEVMLPNNCTRVTGGLLCQHGLQLIDCARINAEICELRLQYWRTFVPRPFHNVLERGLQ